MYIIYISADFVHRDETQIFLVLEILNKLVKARHACLIRVMTKATVVCKCTTIAWGQTFTKDLVLHHGK